MHLVLFCVLVLCNTCLFCTFCTRFSLCWSFLWCCAAFIYLRRCLTAQSDLNLSAHLSLGFTINFLCWVWSHATSFHPEPANYPALLRSRSTCEPKLMAMKVGRYERLIHIHPPGNLSVQLAGGTTLSSEFTGCFSQLGRPVWMEAGGGRRSG